MDCYARRIVSEVKEESNTLQTAVLLEVAGEETSGFQVDTHGTENNGEVLLVAVMNTLVGDALLLDETSLSANLGGNFVVRQTGGREDGNLLSSGNRVHGINGRDTGGDHLLGVFLEPLSDHIAESFGGSLTRE